MKKRNFILLDEKFRDTNHKFKGKYPSRAAIKVAVRGYKIIRLREANTNKVHIYEGKREQRIRNIVPEWLPNKLYVGKIKKITTKRL